MDHETRRHQQEEAKAYPPFFSGSDALEKLAPIDEELSLEIVTGDLFKFQDIDPWQDAHCNITRLLKQVFAFDSDQAAEDLARTTTGFLQTSGTAYRLKDFERFYLLDPTAESPEGTIKRGIDTSLFELEFLALLIVRESDKARKEEREISSQETRSSQALASTSQESFAEGRNEFH